MTDLDESEEKYRADNPGKLRVFSIAENMWRDATQRNLDNLSRFANSVTWANCAEHDKRTPPSDMNFLLATYPNRMRDDGVFVAQLLPIEPYEGIRSMDGRACYPSIPQKGVSLGHQLPHDFARELVRCWNAFHVGEKVEAA